jgi:hypothetical protein
VESEEPRIQMELSLSHEDARDAFEKAHGLLSARSIGSIEGFNHELAKALTPIFEPLSGSREQERRSYQLALYLLEALALEAALAVDHLAQDHPGGKQEVLRELANVIEQRGHI